jgi:hypothetical protein
VKTRQARPWDRVLLERHGSFGIRDTQAGDPGRDVSEAELAECLFGQNRYDLAMYVK